MTRTAKAVPAKSVSVSKVSLESTWEVTACLAKRKRMQKSGLTWQYVNQSVWYCTVTDHTLGSGDRCIFTA